MINYDDYVISYNKQAMNALKNEQMEVAYNLLSQAERILHRKPVSNMPKLLSLTYNNFGCFYKRENDCLTAIQYFHKSISEGSKGKQNSLNIAGTHLNLCTIYSMVEEHPQALSHGLKALKLLAVCVQESESYIFSLIIAYQNIGYEYECISEYNSALKYYRKGLKISLSQLGKDNPITQKLRERLYILQNKMSMWAVKKNDKISSKEFTNRVSISCTPTFKTVKNKSSFTHFSPPSRKVLFTETRPIKEIHHEPGESSSKYFKYELTKKIKYEPNEDYSKKLKYKTEENSSKRANYLLVTPKKKNIYTDISRDTTLNSETSNSFIENKLQASFPRTQTEKPKIKNNRKYIGRKNRSPDNFPIPFKKKISMFSLIQRITP